MHSLELRTFKELRSGHALTFGRSLDLPKGSLLLVTGGSKSGKSSFAEDLASDLGRQTGAPLAYWASLVVGSDLESAERVARHQAQRAHKGFRTLEFPVDLESGRLELPKGSILLFECLGTFLANRLFDLESGRPVDSLLEDPEYCAQMMSQAFLDLASTCTCLILVSNELSQNPFALSPESKAYVKILGRTMAKLVEGGAGLIEVTAGIPLLLKEGRRP